MAIGHLRGWNPSIAPLLLSTFSRAWDTPHGALVAMSGDPPGRDGQEEADEGVRQPGRAVAEGHEDEPGIPAGGVAAAGAAGEQRVCHGIGDMRQAGAAQALQQSGDLGIWVGRRGSARWR